MIHIYTGNGKGKTTSAFGLAIRARGQGLKVVIFQFLKPGALRSGEEVFLKKIRGIRLVKFDHMHPMFGGRTSGKDIERDFEKVKHIIVSRRYDMVILDEIINCVDQNFIDRISFLELLRAVPKDTELVLTGRGDISDIEQYAHYITIMIDKKHPYRGRVDARKGIEY